MGTRGSFGWRVDGQDKLCYNHFDSYPTGLGQQMVDFCRLVEDWDKVKEKVRALENVKDREPTEEDVEACRAYANLNVSNQNTQDWYCLLRETQGDPGAVLACGRYVENNNFILDSLFCEYAYIINLDDHTLEVYDGFQTKPHSKGRYSNHECEVGHPRETKYHPCALVVTFPLDNIPQDWDKDIPE
jgi:hypothetical protein